jgi:hypothetical protein
MKLSGKQLDMIHNHLESIGSISNLEAQSLYRVRSLPRRIRDLEERRGLQIKREWRKDLTGERYMRYHLV